MKKIAGYITSIVMGLALGAAISLTKDAGAQFSTGQTLTAGALNAALASPTILGGSINNAPIGGVTPSTGVFSALTATGTLTGSGVVNLSPANLSVTLAPSGTGVVTINPATAGTINNVAIGDTTRGAGAFTTLQSNSTTTLGATTIATGASANQLRTTQSSPPTCSSNCGTSPSVVGTDTGMVVTMGATGTPSTSFTITFAGTWASTPACTAQMAKSGMVVGKLPIVVSPMVTSITITTNGTSPSNSDRYALICIGVS